jgi:hypothetical protein
MKVPDALDANFIHVADLEGKEWALTIERVAAPGTVRREDKRMIEKSVAYFKETKRGFPLNTTNYRRIQYQHGSEDSKWAGKAVTIYPTTTEITRSMAEENGNIILSVHGKMAVVPCIRVKVPAALCAPPEVRGQRSDISKPEEAEIEF